MPASLEARGEPLADALRCVAAPSFIFSAIFESQLGELVRVEVVEGEVLEVALDPRHAQAVGDRRVDLQRLARDAPARLGRQVLERLHVVQPVGELDQDDPDVLGRGQDHLAEGLGLRLVAAHVRVAADLGDAVDQLGDLLAELRLQRPRGWSACPRARRGAARRRRRSGRSSRSARRQATSSGWIRYGSPERRTWSLCMLGREVVDRAQEGSRRRAAVRFAAARACRRSGRCAAAGGGGATCWRLSGRDADTTTSWALAPREDPRREPDQRPRL